jgi:putative addiction module component (TIGR02574 family)
MAMETVEEILDQAKRLQPRERLHLIQELLLTLDFEDGSISDADWNAAWRPEIEARIAAYERGETQASDWQTVMGRLR